MLAQLYHCFDSQLKLIRQHTYEKVNGEIKKLQSMDVEKVAEKLNKILTALTKSNMESYKKKSESLVI